MLVLIHGGLWEDMDAHRFWVQPGVVDRLLGRRWQVVAPDRPSRAVSWATEVEHLVGLLPDRPVPVVAGSNGCSAAVRLAVEHPERVAGLLLAWPATAADPAVDARIRARLAGLGASPAVMADLLVGTTVRGASDAQIAGLEMPVAVLPSEPDNPYHQRRTVDALLGLIPAVQVLPGCPESPRPEFAAFLDSFVSSVTGFAASLTS